MARSAEAMYGGAAAGRSNGSNGRRDPEKEHG